MRGRAEWLTFGIFVAAIIVAMYLLLQRGFHGRSAALALALLVILLLRVALLIWNLRRQRRQAGGRSRPGAEPR